MEGGGGWNRGGHKGRGGRDGIWVDTGREGRRKGWDRGGHMEGGG